MCVQELMITWVWPRLVIAWRFSAVRPLSCLSGFPCVLWRPEPDNIYLAGDALHRLGQNSAVESFSAKKNGNVHQEEVKAAQTSFWVMRAQATDQVAAAKATVCKALAEAIVNMLLLGGRDLKAALQQANVLETDKKKISTTNLELLFHCHCVVIQGELPGTYFRRCFARRLHKGRRICTCANFAQRGNCAHVWFVAVLQGQIDPAAVPTRAKPGRKRAEGTKAFGGTAAKRQRK